MRTGNLSDAPLIHVENYHTYSSQKRNEVDYLGKHKKEVSKKVWNSSPIYLIDPAVSCRILEKDLQPYFRPIIKIAIKLLSQILKYP